MAKVEPQLRNDKVIWSLKIVEQKLKKLELRTLQGSKWPLALRPKACNFYGGLITITTSRPYWPVKNESHLLCDLKIDNSCLNEIKTSHVAF